MKKILSLIGALTLVGTTSATAIACTSATNNAAQALINKINDASIQITAPLQSQQETTKAREALMQNSSITQQEADELTFSGALEFEASKPVTVIAHVGSQTAVGKINVTLHKPNPTPPPVNPAQALINKIVHKKVNLPAAIPWTDKKTYPNVNNPTISTYIKQLLKVNNSSLTDDDLGKLTLSNATLLPSVYIVVGLTANVDGSTASTSINVKWDISPSQLVVEKIVNKNITVPKKTNPDVTDANTISAIKVALKTANTALTASDLAKIIFQATGPLTTAGIDVTATVFSSEAVASTTLNVKIAS